MDKEQALSKFVREHLAELSDSTATSETIKRLRQAFFHRNNLVAGARFTGKETAELFATNIARSKRAKSVEDVTSQLSSIPFIREELGLDEIGGIAATTRVGDKPSLTTEDLSKIGREDYLESLEERFRNRASQDAEHHLTEGRRLLLESLRLLHDRQEMLESARSSLEAIPPDADLELLIDEEPVHTSVQAAPIWWKEIGLELDPFSSNRGLSDIPEAKYDEVVVKTPFVGGFVDRMEKQPESFFGKTIVVLGEFGSGKTTLFQLVGSKAATHGILPIITSVHPDVSVSRLMTQLIGQLREALLQSFPHVADGSYPVSSEGTDDIGRAIHALAEVTRRAATTKGFLLFVDGLHKSETYLKQSLEFLAQIQTLQERFELRKLRLGILVAGSTRWETELRANPALSGSFYSIESIPLVSEDQAVEAVIRRVRSFTPAGGTPPTIIRAPLRIAYQVLNQRLLRQPTFRDYLDHVRDRFVARDYSSLGVSISLHTETVRLVKSLVEKSPLASSYRFLTDSTQHGPRLQGGLKRVLPEVCVRKGINDSDPFVEKFKGVFVLLLRQSWIVKRLDPHERVLRWHLSEQVVEFLQSAQEATGKTLPSEILEALFTEVEKVVPGEVESIYGPIIRQMEQMLATWRPSLPEVADNVGRALEKTRSIDAKCKSEGGQAGVEVGDEIRTSILSLVRAVDFVIGAKASTSASPLDVFQESWCAPENCDAIGELTRRTVSFDPSRPESYGSLLTHAQALSDLCELLSSAVRGEAICRLAGRRLTPQDSLKLHSARTAFLGQQYQSTIEKLCDLVESKIRDVVFTSLRCFAGDRALSFAPSDVRSRLKDGPRGHPRARRGPDKNFLFDISRSEYSKFLFSAEFGRTPFGRLLAPDEARRPKDSLELLFSVGDRDAHRDRPNYFREHATEIGSVLQFVPRFCEILNQIAETVIADPGFAVSRRGTSLVYGFGPSTDGWVEHSLSSEEVEGLVRDVLDRLEGGELEIPPFEATLLSLHGNTEVALAGVRACAMQSLVYVEAVRGGFGYKVGLTELGESRLAKLRSTHSRTGPT